MTTTPLSCRIEFNLQNTLPDLAAGDRLEAEVMKFQTATPDEVEATLKELEKDGALPLLLEHMYQDSDAGSRRNLFTALAGKISENRQTQLVDIMLSDTYLLGRGSEGQNEFFFYQPEVQQAALQKLADDREPLFSALEKANPGLTDHITARVAEEATRILPFASPDLHARVLRPGILNTGRCSTAAAHMQAELRGIGGTKPPKTNAPGNAIAPRLNAPTVAQQGSSGAASGQGAGVQQAAGQSAVKKQPPEKAKPEPRTVDAKNTPGQAKPGPQDGTASAAHSAPAKKAADKLGEAAENAAANRAERQPRWTKQQIKDAHALVAPKQERVDKNNGDGTWTHYVRQDENLYWLSRNSGEDAWVVNQQTGEKKHLVSTMDKTNHLLDQISFPAKLLQPGTPVIIPYAGAHPPPAWSGGPSRQTELVPKPARQQPAEVKEEKPAAKPQPKPEPQPAPQPQNGPDMVFTEEDTKVGLAKIESRQPTPQPGRTDATNLKAEPSEENRFFLQYPETSDDPLVAAAHRLEGDGPAMMALLDAEEALNHQPDGADMLVEAANSLPPPAAKPVASAKASAPPDDGVMDSLIEGAESGGNKEDDLESFFSDSSK